jgi:hypothetical protein
MQEVFPGSRRWRKGNTTAEGGEHGNRQVIEQDYHLACQMNALFLPLVDIRIGNHKAEDEATTEPDGGYHLLRRSFFQAFQRSRSTENCCAGHTVLYGPETAPGLRSRYLQQLIWYDSCSCFTSRILQSAVSKVL